MRHEFSRKTKRAAWERCGGNCEGKRYQAPWPTMARSTPLIEVRCNAPLAPGRYVFDHIDPDWISGCDDLDNCQVICTLCHKLKTAHDQADIAKVKRIRDKAIKAKTSRRPLPGGKHDWRKKKLDGTVVDRRTGRRL